MNSLQETIDYLELKGISTMFYPESEDGPILCADWNPIDHEEYSQLEEKLDIKLEWDDEWTSCYDCGKGIRISPTSYSWQPKFIQDNEGFEICADCFENDPEAYLEAYIDNPLMALHEWAIPIIKNLGYYEYPEERYETGFHPGQNDNPIQISNQLREKKIYDYVFVVTSTGQFDIDWTVFVREKEIKEE